MVLVLALGLALPMAMPVAASPGPGIVGLWHFDGNANDSSGTIPPNNGTVTGATYVASPMGQALSFDGDDYVTVSDSSSLDITGAITIEAWIYPTDVGVGVGAYRGIVAKRYGNFANYALRLDDGGRLDFYYSGPSATNTVTDWNVWHTTNRVISPNSWYHVAVTFTFAGGPIAAYVNGSPVSGAWYAGGPTDPATANDYALRIGMAYPGYPQYFKGLIDEVRIWNEALTATQIGDITPPTGSVTINSDAQYTNSTSVTLNLAATDAVGVTGYRVANGTDASGGTTVVVPSTTSFSASIPWSLAAGDGTKTVAVQYRDAALNWSPNYTDTIILDQTPPIVTVTLPGTGVYLLNEVVSASWMATDALSGVVPPHTGTIPLDTSSVGAKTLTVPAGTAVDNAGNPSAAVNIQYSVGYGFIGLLPPYVAPPKAFKIGSSIPLKWQYTDSGGTVVDSSVANPSVKIRLVIAGTTPTEGDPITIDDPGSSGLRYDSLTMTWQFNWQTKSLTAGIYNIRIISGQTSQANGPFPVQLR